eukprot:CAMPEP_0115212916 /NCGR_PEP_ID=MMETSP0270-20121206/23529_1 /TAXON_ID=71861 /ORGANISM="Scrippsiella trochoidea, Strain CCMP3099" /LENGTH=60 /DNA_ID=CAMNT_0002626657 /DNA_START=1023 /DNA_END=1201 /DNA_ORIENTATION=-
MKTTRAVPAAVSSICHLWHLDEHSGPPSGQCIANARPSPSLSSLPEDEQSETLDPAMDAR